MSINLLHQEQRVPKVYSYRHGLRTPNEGINQIYLKIWAAVADKICFGRTYKFGSGSEFSAVQWRSFPLWVSVVRGTGVSKFNFKWANSIQKKLLSYALWVTLPYTVKDFSIWKYPDIDVRNDDFMLSSFLFITKEGIWHPHFSWIC